MTDQFAEDREPTDLPTALIELRHARAEVERLRPFVDMLDQAHRDAEATPDNPAVSYPHRDGEFTVLGPEIFASSDGAVICWKGENYVRQGDPATSGDGLRERYAAAIDRLQDTGGIYAIEDAERYRVADAVMAVRDRHMEQLEAKVADYEHRIGWHTTCQSCARILDSAYSETVRAEQAEAAIARVRALAADMHGITGARTWATWLDNALDGPAPAAEPDPFAGESGCGTCGGGLRTVTIPAAGHDDAPGADGDRR